MSLAPSPVAMDAVLSVLVLSDVEGNERVKFDAAVVLLMTCFVCSIKKFFISSVDISAAMRCFDEGSTSVAIRTASVIRMRHGRRC